MSGWTAELEAAVRAALGVQTPLLAQARGGGCICGAFLLRTRAEAPPLAFLKVHSAVTAAEMFAAEATALSEWAAAGSGLRVPRPLGAGVAGEEAWLLLEFLPLRDGLTAAPAEWAALGEGLARLHRTRSPQGGFGWWRDNTLGSTLQRNPWTTEWAAFFRDHRLAPQFELAAARGRTFPHAPRLMEQVPALLADHQPVPSLLHGDLWSGNAGFLEDGSPAIFDPASYYGDRETDLAFSRLFGGFPPAFYTAYENAWPLPAGHERRARLYNLYHLLNHFHLFGAPYDRQAEACLAALLS